MESEFSVSADPLAIELPAHDGSTFNLAARRGIGPTTVVFFRGHWCPYCRHYLTRLQRQSKNLNEGNRQLVAICPEPVHTCSALAHLLDLTYPLLSDTSGEVILRYGVRSGFRAVTALLPHPAVFIFDADLKLRFRSIDKNYKRRARMRTILDQLNQIDGGRRSDPAEPTAS
ncbi:MAG TPA: peroxiredoxin-like family protein [Tepidisphaeraceae bacterium]|jgi:peroxiredoxin